jgi:phage tail-like protein
MTIAAGSSTLDVGIGLSGQGSVLVSGSGTASIAISLQGDLIKPVLLGRVRALSSTRIRIDFSRPVRIDAALTNVASYSFTPNGGAVVPAVLRVDAPPGTSTSFVELIVSEMTAGSANYALGASEIRDPFGAPLASDLVTFDGVGEPPTIRLAVARSATTVQVYFSEQVYDLGDLRNPSAYSFSGAELTVLAVLDVDVDNVVLSTTPQTEGHLYGLVYIGTLYDYAMNQMVVPVEAPMLGYITKLEPQALLTLKMYNFIIESVRNEDQTRGNAFLQRFLQGPQEIWAAIVKTIFDLPKLWSITDIPDEWLHLQKGMVGWTPDTDDITNSLDAPTLRRLMASSIPFWKRRGVEDSTEDVVRLVTGGRAYIVNWFQSRFILDEAHLGVEMDGSDPWLLSTPGEGEPDAWTYNLRVVDEGTVDRDVVRALARLTRPQNERVLITYLRFLDQFTTDDDISQWDSSNAPSITVAGGSLSMLDELSGEDAFVNVELASDWTSYVARWRVRGSDAFVLHFYRTGPGDMYLVRVDIVANTVALTKLLGGIETTLVTASIASYGEVLYDDVYYTITVEVAPSLIELQNAIRVQLDGQVIIETESDGTHAQGTLGVAHDVAGTVEVDSLEMFFLPGQTDFVDINS